MLNNLDNLGIRLSENDVVLFFARYATTNNLTYSQFSDAFLPSDGYYCRLLISKRLTYSQQCSNLHTFSDPTIHLYLSLFECLISVERAAESIKQRLVRRHNFSMPQAFRTLDFNSDGFVTLSDVSLNFSNLFKILSLIHEYGFPRSSPNEV